MTLVPALYGPGPEWIRKLKYSTEICITAAIPFEKGLSFNRLRILSASGPLLLSIPVKKNPAGSLLSDLKTDPVQKWQNQHWRSLFSAYGKSPYFAYYKDELEPIFLAEAASLPAFTSAVLAWTLRQYFPKAMVQVNLAALPEPDIAGTAYLSPWEDHQEKKETNFRYRQVFGSEFVPGLSALDHLFCAGPGNL